MKVRMGGERMYVQDRPHFLLTSFLMPLHSSPPLVVWLVAATVAVVWMNASQAARMRVSQIFLEEITQDIQPSALRCQYTFHPADLLHIASIIRKKSTVRKPWSPVTPAACREARAVCVREKEKTAPSM